MKKTQRIALMCSIIFCINYALDKLLGFDMISSFFVNHYWLDNISACIIGVIGFYNILLFKKED